MMFDIENKIRGQVMSWKMTAEELLERYAAGERDFAGVNLNGVDLSNSVLREINSVCHTSNNV